MRSPWLSIALVAAAIPASASGTVRYALDIPAGSLRDTAARLAIETRSSIALADPELGRLRVPRITGTMSAEKALRRALRGLPVQLLVIDPSTFRVTRALRPRVAVRAPPPSRPPRPAAARAPVATGADIIVTATKRDLPQSRIAGAIDIVRGDDLALTASTGTDAVLRQATSLSSTRLGPGRERLFLRALGDSSYSGQTQATVGEFLGEARLNYTGPDPALRLYDIKRVELLLGPQGALYGAGSLGGIIRIEPNRPDPSGPAANILLSASATEHGALGAEAAAALNLPLGALDSAFRLVGYRVREGGVIDDIGLGKDDVDRVDVTGGRILLGFSPAPDWHAEVTALLQDLDAQGPAFADRRYGDLRRSTALAQPYSGRYRLGAFTLRHDRGTIRLVANLSRSHSGMHDSFDTSELSPQLQSLTRDNRADVSVAELRLSEIRPSGSRWLVGGAYLSSLADSSSSLSDRSGGVIVVTSRSRIREATLFGEGARQLGLVSLEFGLRLARWSSDAQSSEAPGTGATSERWVFLPSLSLLLDARPDMQLFVRYARSYRPPTTIAAPGLVNSLKGDRYQAWEGGIRFLPSWGPRKIEGSLSGSLGRWRDVQAETVDNVGYLLAANIGNARLFTLEAALRLSLGQNLELSAGATFNHTALVRDAPSTIITVNGQLPNIPDLSARTSLTYTSPPGTRRPLRLSANLAYRGKSSPGIGPLLGREQGGFVDVAADASVSLGQFRPFVKVSNLFDARGNWFALGTILQTGSGEQFVPQRPRTITIGLRWNGGAR